MWLRNITSKSDDFWALFDQPVPEVVKTDEPRSEDYTLILYRGFDADINKLERSNGGYVLSPHRSEQGVIWFTHELINGYDPKEYVTGRGKYVLEYPLQCIRHLQRIQYADGRSFDIVPKDISAKSEPTENCKFYRGFELPDGWLFSYKNEKFIICNIPIVVLPSMIKQGAAW